MGKFSGGSSRGDFPGAILRGAIHLFNLFINDLFYFIYMANLHNYADDSTLSNFANTIPNLIIKILKQETNTAISCLTNNNMIVPEKFHCIILTKNKADTSEIEVRISDKVIKSEQNVKGEVRSIFIFWYFVLYNMKILST